MNVINRLMNMIRRARTTLPMDDSGQYPVVQATYNNKTTLVHQIQPYGFYSSPPLDSEMITWNVLGQEENKAGIADNSKLRFKNLKPGEVVVGNTITRSNAFFDAEGNLNITVVNNEVVNITGNCTINVTGDLTTTANKIVSTSSTTVDITCSGDATITCPTVKMTGDLEVDGDITDNAQGNINTMANMRATYNSHTHNENGTGGGVTDAPNQPI